MDLIDVDLESDALPSSDVCDDRAQILIVFLASRWAEPHPCERMLELAGKRVDERNDDGSGMLGERFRDLEQLGNDPPVVEALPPEVEGVNGHEPAGRHRAQRSEQLLGAIDRLDLPLPTQATARIPLEIG